MTVDPSVIPGLLFLLAEFVALAAVGYVIVRTALRESDDRVALAQGLVVGPAIWVVVVNLVMYAIPGMAGALAGWIFVLALAAVLVWRAPESILPRLRIAAGFALIALALFWIVLASRQMLGIPDTSIHIGLAASIREGGFPPELPWNPGLPVLYHYGTYLLNGLLAPPSGPDLAFAEELLGAYVWVSLVLIVITALLRRASGIAILIIAPLLLTTGAWTFRFGEPAGILQTPVPAGIPAAGLRASLMDIYWPSVELPWSSRLSALPNIWKPAFALSYALSLVVLAHAARAGRKSWSATLTLAALIGFLGLTSTSLAPIVLVLWTGLEAIHLIQSRGSRSLQRSDVIRSASGLVLAAILLLAGGFSSLVLGDSVSSGMSLGTSEFFGGWRLLGTLDRLPGGVGILGLGPLAVAGAAVLLARRDRLVLALAAGTVTLLLVTLLFTYEPQIRDLVRLEGHARNFALFALLIALSVRLARLHTRWRYAAGAALVALVTWPTVVMPARNLGLAIGNGIELANARPSQQRYALRHLASDRIAAYIRNHTAIDAPVFSPDPKAMMLATGRPNASGFVGHIHLIARQGPEYRDVLDYLEPAAVRRLGFEYVHAPDSWLESLPAEAAAWLNDSNLFELLVRDGSESLYRVLPAFLTLDPPPAPASYEALRQAVPASATVLLPRAFETTNDTFRVASALSHTQLLGVISPRRLHFRTPWRAEPLGDHVPDLVVAPASFVPWMFPPASRQPIWHSEETAVYALEGTVDPIMPPPPRAEPFPFSVRVSDLRAADGRAVFTATFDNRASDQWSGQDWIMIAIEAPPWDLHLEFLPDGITPVTHLWFSGQIGPGAAMTSITYELDFLKSTMAFRRSGGAWTPAGASEAESGPGVYMLAVRLRHEYKPNQWRPVAYIPVLRITISETGEFSYQVYEEADGVAMPVR